MKRNCLLFLLILLFSACSNSTFTKEKTNLAIQNGYTPNRTPLINAPYLELPLGSIKPEGWLKDQLQRMASGMTGNLDTLYPEVVGERNGWLGGDGDGWERGPYWIDGLLPLAYILDDAELKAKVKPWVEWTLTNQRKDGYIGPILFKEKPEYEPSLQRDMQTDWWPKMVMLKILQQYYTATEDERVITMMTKYFKYQLKTLPNLPLDHHTFWANRRGGDNLQIVYWLYNKTGDKFLLELANLLHEQTFPWTEIYLNENPKPAFSRPYSYFDIKGYPFDSSQINGIAISQQGSIHTVNLAQGLKTPVVRYQYEQNDRYLQSVKKALADIKKYHGQPSGMYGGDEPLHGTNPVQGVEFCSISEKMFSLETILKITGDTEIADLLERITYNALPTQHNDDFTERQYFQAANQVELSDRLETAFESKNHKNTDFVYGLFGGYVCCTCNMHQAWPKFVQNLFYATPNGGVAALLYAPSNVTMKVANGVDLSIKETTGFPFREEVNFEMMLSVAAQFDFHLRIPAWAKNAQITVNGKVVTTAIERSVAIINRKWKSGDKITLKLPMQTTVSKWHENTATIEHGPLAFALHIPAKSAVKNRNDNYKDFTEYYPTGDWNYGLLTNGLDNITGNIQIKERDWNSSIYPWNDENAPLEITLQGVKIPGWKLNNGTPQMADIPKNYKVNMQNGKPLNAEQIRLIPYGCTTLRISEFPVLGEE